MSTNLFKIFAKLQLISCNIVCYRKVFYTQRIPREKLSVFFNSYFLILCHKIRNTKILKCLELAFFSFSKLNRFVFC